jgi:hypothetical protein
MPNSVEIWLNEIADNLERWPPENGKCSPTEAAFTALRHAPPAVRAQLAGALPLLPTEDFAEAVALIRQASKKFANLGASTLASN